MSAFPGYVSAFHFSLWNVICAVILRALLSIGLELTIQLSNLDGTKDKISTSGSAADS